MPPPASDEVQNQVERILTSEVFAGSARLSRFLRYVVTRALAGESDALKEYVIGVEVFDRDAQYDPRLDSIVRVEAGRLRAKLDDYYQRVGAADPVVIHIPRGGYAPQFTMRAETASPPVEMVRTATPVVPAGSRASGRRRVMLAAAAVLAALLAGVAAFRPWTAPASPVASVAVLPFWSYAPDEAVVLLAARVTDGVTTELARLNTLSVVSHTTAVQFAGEQRPLRDVARDLHADVVVEATLHSSPTEIRVEARLVDVKADRKVWVKDFTAEPAAVGDLQRQIAAAVADAVLSRLGRTSLSR